MLVKKHEIYLKKLKKKDIPKIKKKKKKKICRDFFFFLK